MALILTCKNCGKNSPPPHFTEESLCLACADVTREEFYQALEMLGGTRFGNQWVLGVEALAFKLAKTNRSIVSELYWQQEEDFEVAKVPYGFAVVYRDHFWEVFISDPNKEPLLISTSLRFVSDIQKVKAIAGRHLVQLRPLVGLLDHLSR